MRRHVFKDLNGKQETAVHLFCDRVNKHTIALYNMKEVQDKRKLMTKDFYPTL